jgi:dipeptidyl aminopeptidase/acylaminoacyl peptidase
MDEENDVSELARWVRVQSATAVTLADQPRGGGGPPRLIRRGLIVAVDKVRNADPPEELFAQTPVKGRPVPRVAYRARKGAVMVGRQDVEFAVEGDVILRAWLFVPDREGRHPGITMAHGFAGVKEHGLERFAHMFADAGFVVLVHDHRGFGASGGSPRFDIDPWVQIADWRRAISFLENHPAVDPDRIGLWGTSYAGGHEFPVISQRSDLW